MNKRGCGISDRRVCGIYHDRRGCDISWQKRVWHTMTGEGVAHHDRRGCGISWRENIKSVWWEWAEELSTSRFRKLDVYTLPLHCAMLEQHPNELKRGQNRKTSPTHEGPGRGGLQTTAKKQEYPCWVDQPLEETCTQPTTDRCTAYHNTVAPPNHTSPEYHHQEMVSRRGSCWGMDAEEEASL